MRWIWLGAKSEHNIIINTGRFTNSYDIGKFCIKICVMLDVWAKYFVGKYISAKQILCPKFFHEFVFKKSQTVGKQFFISLF